MKLLIFFSSSKIIISLCFRPWLFFIGIQYSPLFFSEKCFKEFICGPVSHDKEVENKFKLFYIFLYIIGIYIKYLINHKSKSQQLYIMFFFVQTPDTIDTFSSRAI